MKIYNFVHGRSQKPVRLYVFISVVKICLLETIVFLDFSSCFTSYNFSQLIVCVEHLTILGLSYIKIHALTTVHT